MITTLIGLLSVLAGLYVLGIGFAVMFALTERPFEPYLHKISQSDRRTIPKLAREWEEENATKKAQYARDVYAMYQRLFRAPLWPYDLCEYATRDYRQAKAAVVDANAEDLIAQLDRLMTEKAELDRRNKRLEEARALIQKDTNSE